MKVTFTDYYVVKAVAGRDRTSLIGLSACHLCGATIIVDESGNDYPKRHEEWHNNAQLGPRNYD